MKNGHSAFLVFLNKDHVSAYKRYHIKLDWTCQCFNFQHSDTYSTSSLCRLCMVGSALKGRGVTEIIANAR